MRSGIGFFRCSVSMAMGEAISLRILIESCGSVVYGGRTQARRIP